jgi:PAT family beta-lactamase induction signal transducer AmpG
MLVSGAGALYVVDGAKWLGVDIGAAWTVSYAVMAACVMIGILTALYTTEPEKSAAASADHAAHAADNPLRRVAVTAVGAFSEFLSREMAFVSLAFVVLFKFTDALAGIMTAPFVYDLGFSPAQYATIIKGVGLAATLIGGFAGGFLARAYPLPTCLWIGGVLQALANLAFCWQAAVSPTWMTLSIAITVENFTSAIGTVIFVAYLSALCRNPLHTATQYALLTALAAFGRTYLSSGAGFLAAATGWVWFFATCAAAGLPGLVLLAWLQRRGHFTELGSKRKEAEAVDGGPPLPSSAGRSAS